MVYGASKLITEYIKEGEPYSAVKKEDTLTKEELIAYKRFQENRRIERSVIETALKEGEEKGLEKGIEKGMGIVIKVYQMHQAGKTFIEIAEAVDLSVVEV